VIHLFTDFGLDGPYIGHVKAVLHRAAPGVPVIDLCADAPAFDPRAASYLLAAYDTECAAGDIIVAVVDPGVGGARAAVALEIDGKWYVGPANGIFEAAIAQADGPVRCWEITWRPDGVSHSFHGRDIFAPVAALLATGVNPADEAADGDQRFRPADAQRFDWPADLGEVIYVDHFGNLITGLRAAHFPPDGGLVVGGERLPRRRTFSDVSYGEAFCYENANGLMEIAVNAGRADAYFGLAVGAVIGVHEGK